MSTFKGFVEEFPDIRIDYFWKIPGRDNPLACFLSHVHSDHLQGLESLHSPFIYCSPTTRELLLRIEKYPHRMNFHRGVLEIRKQHYKHLSKLLKTIALNTPTEVELKRGKSLRVTLLDANHCAGAVMFLIESDNKAILYTGDIRSEPWWVNSLIRNPVVLPYTHGLKRLDKIYLDTTFASKKNHHLRFPTKANGLKELLEKVSKYPIDTVFHFHAWTFGYEDVWIALSSALRSQIHVDKYKYSLYESLGTSAKKKNFCHESTVLYGFDCGNRFQDGCLTPKHNVRLHSCQHEMRCSALEAPNIVYIRPIISRSTEGLVLPEVGAGGGGGDLNQLHELELNDAADVKSLIDLCTKEIVDQEIRSNTIDLISKASESQKMAVSFALDHFGARKTIPLANFAKLLAKLVVEDGEVSQVDERAQISRRTVGRNWAKTVETCSVMPELPRSIDFPYSRHSSYEELCDLVRAFEPIDIYPCTIGEEYMDLSMNLLASQRQTLTRRTNEGDSQAMTSSRDETVDQRDTSSMGLLGSGSDSEFHALEGLERVLGRPRTSPLFRRNYQGELDMGNLSTEVSSPKRKLPEFQQSFKSHVRHSKKMKAFPSLGSTGPPTYHDGGYMGMSGTAISGYQGSSTPPRLKSDPRANTPQNGRLASRPAAGHRGTQAEPIELIDGDPSSPGNEAGDFLLEEMPKPDDIPSAPKGSQLDPETQVTLSDAAFESQSSHKSKLDIKAIRLQQRKEAYKAAKGPGGDWESDHGLISSSAHHGEEEVEL